MVSKQVIQEDFLLAFRAKDDVKKAALSSIKAEITKVEKANKNIELTPDGVLKVIVSGVKQRKQSIEEFAKGGRQDLVDKEQRELEVLESYLPRLLNREEIEQEVKGILKTFSSTEVRNKVVGQTMGLLNKKFPGQIDSKIASEVITSLVP